MIFLVDRMLGRLARHLRMLGYDAVYYRGDDPVLLMRLAREQDRTILTRNTKLLPKRPEDKILRVAEDRPLLQLKELLQKGIIELEEENLFSRCLLCNVPIEGIERVEAEGKVPDFILYQQKEFYRCPQCQKIYWPGSHLGNMQNKVEGLIDDLKKTKPSI